MFLQSVGRCLSVLHNVSQKTVIWLDFAYVMSLFEVTAKSLCHRMFVWCADYKAESVRREN
jgi:hypothetical protein